MSRRSVGAGVGGLGFLGAALFACSGVAGFAVAGVKGVRFGALPVRVVVQGAALAPDVVYRESWYTRHPGEGGGISLWPGNSTETRAVQVEGASVSVDLPRGSWCFFSQTFEAGSLAGVDLMPVALPYDGPCRIIEGKGDLRVEASTLRLPTCFGYVPAQTTSIEVVLDATPMNLIWADAKKPGPERIDGRLVVAPGASTVFGLRGMRTSEVWPSTDRTPFDAPLTALAIDPGDWERLAGPADGAHACILARERWDALFAASATSALGWDLKFDGDHFVVTAPDVPGSRAHVAVAGFGPEDEQMQVWDDVLEVATPPPAPVPVPPSEEGPVEEGDAG